MLESVLEWLSRENRSLDMLASVSACGTTVGNPTDPRLPLPRNMVKLCSAVLVPAYLEVGTVNGDGRVTSVVVQEQLIY